MRLSNLAIAFAAIAAPAYAADEALATGTDIKTNAETLEKEVESEINTLEAEINTLEEKLADGSSGTVTDGTDTSTEPTTDDKTLTTDPCPLQATVMCDVGMVMIEEDNPDNPDCPIHECVPNLCADTEDLSLSSDTTSCERYLDGDCYRYKCATVDPPPPTYCSLNPETDDTCQGDYIKTGVSDDDGCINVICCDPSCARNEKVFITNHDTCQFECVSKKGGGDDGTDGGGEGKTKPCRANKCRRKNLRA